MPPEKNVAHERFLPGLLLQPFLEILPRDRPRGKRLIQCEILLFIGLVHHQ